MVANTPKKKRAGASAAPPADGFAEIKDVIIQMESVIKEAEALAAVELRRIDEIKESLRTAASRLAALFREKDELLSTRSRTTKELEEGFTARIRELEKQLQEKQALLLAREEMLTSLGARTFYAGAPTKATIAPPAETAPLTHSSAREGGGFPVGEPDANSGTVNRRETERTASRLVSLLGPIKRRN